MTTSSRSSDAERTRVASRIDKHFDITEYLLDHPEILEALPHGTELNSESMEGIWLRLPSVLQSTCGNEAVGDPPASYTTISGTEVHGPQRASNPPSLGRAAS